MMYGLIHTIVVADCKNLNNGLFTGALVEEFFLQLIPRIGMVIAPIEQPIQIWEDHNPHQVEFKIGTSANVFIETSNISIHACDPQRSIRICIFTCRQHDEAEAVDFCREYWMGDVVQSHILDVQ